MTTLAELALADACAVPESRVPADLLASLPLTTSAPPWHCRLRAVVWVQRAVAPLPSGSPYAGRALGLTVGAVVDYLDTPVGPYREVFAGPLLRARGWPTLHVPFIAVDSTPSVSGGRAHWQLPKVLAGFSGDVGAGSATVTGDGWSVGVAAAARGPRLPFAAVLAASQGGRRAALRLRGRGRLARVQVEAIGPSLSGWLGKGRHPGVVASGRMVVGPAQPEEALSARPTVHTS
jgi:hypothetical protein